MRIIGGNFKGKRILDPQDKETRPLKDLAKESIFNILKHSNKFSIKIENSIILDLFSGVGSFGLECLSRGAKYVTFVENYSGVLPILKRNLSNLKIEGKYQVINDNILNNINFKKIINKCDIIFLDPPYKEKKLPIIIDQISRDKILSDDGIVIIHRHKKEEDQFTKKFKILVEKKYGISKILFGKLN
jgi:16S rRNA (guanine966-N2)-methyltransferase